MNNQKLTASYRFGVILVALCISGILSRECLFDDQMLTPEGECVECPFCPGGEGMDLEQEVKKNKDGDPLECRECKPCERGYYNDPEDYQYGCRPCPTPCYKNHRKEYIPCGGSTKGLCGACINSDFEDKDNNLDSPCTLRNESQTMPSLLTQLTNASQSSAETQRTNKIHDVPKYSTVGISIQWICLIIAVVLFVGIVVVCVVKKFRGSTVNRDPELGKDVSSKATMISSTYTTSSSLIDSTFNVTNNLSNDTDLEEDAPMLTAGCDRKPPDAVPQPRQARQELSLSSGMPSSGPECLHSPTEPLQQRQYPRFLLTANDDYIKYTSEHIFEEGKMNAMFREMGLSDQFIHSEFTLYALTKQNYNDMTIHYLRKWVEKAGRNATFDVLCHALDKHGFADVADILLKMFHGHDKLG